MSYDANMEKRLRMEAEASEKRGFFAAMPRSADLSAALAEIERLRGERERIVATASTLSTTLLHVADLAVHLERIALAPAAQGQQEHDSQEPSASDWKTVNGRAEEARSLRAVDDRAAPLPGAGDANTRHSSTSGTRERVAGGDAEGAGETALNETPAPPSEPRWSLIYEGVWECSKCAAICHGWDYLPHERICWTTQRDVPGEADAGARWTYSDCGEYLKCSKCGESVLDDTAYLTAHERTCWPASRDAAQAKEAGRG